MWHGYVTQHMWGTGWLSMGLFMSLFWIIAVFAVVGVVWGLLRGGDATTLHPADDRALQVLKERYARGEIGKEEYLEKRRELER